MKAFGILFLALIGLTACSLRTPTPGEAQAAIEAFFLESSSEQAYSAIARCAPIAHYRLIDHANVEMGIRFSALPPNHPVTTREWTMKFRFRDGAFHPEGVAAKDLPCVLLNVESEDYRRRADPQNAQNVMS